MIYYEVDPLAVAAQKQLVKGMEEAGFEVNDVAGPGRRRTTSGQTPTTS